MPVGTENVFLQWHTSLPLNSVTLTRIQKKIKTETFILAAIA